METLIIDPQTVSSIERALSELGKVKVVPADVAAHVRTKKFCRCCMLVFFVRLSLFFYFFICCRRRCCQFS